MCMYTYEYKSAFIEMIYTFLSLITIVEYKHKTIVHHIITLRSLSVDLINQDRLITQL